MPVLGCGAEMAKLMDVANDDVATIEEVIAERLALGVSQAQAQRQAVDEALAQLAAERSMVMKAVMEQLGVKEEATAEPVAPVTASKPDQTETPEFKRWFGDSKVVDSDGNPLVVYHGTHPTSYRPFPKNGIEDFTTPAWFGPKEVAGDYGKGMDGAQMYPVYLSLQNPKITTDEDLASDGVYDKDPELDGYDGVILLDRNGSLLHAVAFYPTQIKSAIGNNGQFDPTNPDIRFSNKSAIGFYSALSDEVGKINAKAQPADGWKAQIKGLIAKGAVKADEVEWTGLNDWLDLQTGKVTKEQVQEFLKNNGVQVQEVTLSDEESGMAVDDWLENWAENNPGPTADAILDGEPWDVTRKIAKENGDTAVLNRIERKIYPAKYSQYTLPGGENYREVLLTLPSDSGFQITDNNGDTRTGFKNRAEAEAERDRVEQETSRTYYVEPTERAGEYRSSHWDAPNVLAHIRLNDRTDADGNKVLFVEEVQSDWGQDGKKKGFQVKGGQLTPEQDRRFTELSLRSQDELTPAESKELMGLMARLPLSESERIANKSKLPAAPFVTKTEGWLNLALKRVITMAAEGGYDRVAFTTGEQNAERFSLDKKLSEIAYEPAGDGKFEISAKDLSGREVISEDEVSLDRIEELVGKEIAEKISRDEGDRDKDGYREWRYLRGDNLKVEAKGMRAFYDKIVPAAVNTMLKKLGGGKLQSVAIEVGAPRAESGPAAAWNFVDRAKSQQPGFDITDAMREKAEAGMPLFANKARPAPLAEETRWQAFRRVIQDQYLPVLKVQEALISGGGTVTPQLDVYRAEERMHGRAQEKLIDFGRNLLEPLLKKAADFGIELDELAAYAYAKHAQERNAHIDQINPVMRGAGSGMDDATAQNILQMVQLAGDQAKFDELHADLMRLTEATRLEYLRSGLISQDTYDAWTSNYENYVPLRGFENVDDEGTARPGVGSGLSIKGKESLRALGRRSRAADIIENIVAEHERAVLRAERNNVAKTFLALAQANPNPDLWEIQPRKLQRSFDRSRDLVVYNQAPDTTDTIGAKVGGQQVYVKVKDPLLLRSLTQAGKDKAGALHGTVVRTLGMYTNLLRNTLTRYNPVFGAINAVRDAPMGALSAYDTLGGEGAKLYAKYYAEAMAASWRHERGAPNMSKDMDRWLKEMRLAGGTTSGVYMRDVEEIKGDLRMMMLQAGAAPKNLREKMLAGKPAKAAHAALHWLEIVGSTSEDAARLAAYRAAREVGKSAAEAASIAKNLTTNFNRSGEWGASINGLYLFFNAGVQGTTRLAQALTNPRVQAVLAAGVAGAAAVALANASVGGDDDDGVPYWEKIPDYEKERNLIIMLPPGVEMDGATEIGKKARYIKIPVQYGLNMFMVLGYQIADLARHVKDPARGVSPEKAAINMTSAVFGSINPFGGALDPTDPIQVGMALLPTAGDTVLQLMSGTNAFGKPVGPAKSAYDTKPDSETYSPAQAGTASQRLAGWLNSVTGGNEGRSGMIDVMPGTLDNVVRNTTGGLGMFVSSLVNLPIKAWHVPENVGPKDTPLWRNLYGELTAASEVGRFYENRAKAMDELGNYEREQKLGIERTYTPKEEALQAMGESAASYNKQMSAIRKEEIEIALDDKMPERDKRLARRKLELERAALAKEYNSEFVKAMEEADRKK